MTLTNLGKKINTASYKNGSKARRRVLVILALIFIALVLPGSLIYFGTKETLSHSKVLVAAYKEQNFDSLKREVLAAKSGLQKIDFSLNFLFWLRLIPFLGGYYQDAKGFARAGVEELTAINKLLTNLEPAKAEIGFDNHPKNGPDRVTQLLKILDKSLPKLDQIQDNLAKAAESVEKIDVSKYPQSFKGKSIRKNLSVAKNFIIGASVAVKKGRAALTYGPKTFGVQSSKNYLLLFQNDKEIRPTGGFITAFAKVTINYGQVTSTTSDDIYRLDEKLLNVCLTKICPLSPPTPIVKYLPEVTGKTRSAWSMRDSNISPDVPTSARQFEKMYQFLGEGLPFDGIIFIDTQVVEELIEVTGPIDVLGTKYSAETDKRCHCPNVIYELENYAEIAAKGDKDRKAILGVLMQQILARSLGSEVEKAPQLIETLATMANHKHVIFYMHDEATQKALSDLNWTGEIKNYDGDYLHINDSNFAGGKSNLYVEQKITQEIKREKGEIRKKISIEYKNPQPFGVWLNGINRDYVRFYVPKGSKLIFSKGSEDAVNAIEDLDKVVFEAFVQIRPQNSRKLEIEYTIPYQPQSEYKLLIQKQPGAKDFQHIIKFNGSQKAKFNLDQDKEFKFNI